MPRGARVKQHPVPHILNQILNKPNYMTKLGCIQHFMSALLHSFFTAVVKRIHKWNPGQHVPPLPTEPCPYNHSIMAGAKVCSTIARFRRRCMSRLPFLLEGGKNCCLYMDEKMFSKNNPSSKKRQLWKPVFN